jgi:ABC-type branched-subunit amino acid transport system ATPase component
VSYADIEVRHGVDLEVHTGEIVALLGANAAGKTTLPQAVSGVLRPRRGTIALPGQDVTGWPPPKLVRRGIWGLASVLVDGIFELLEQLNAQGRTVLLVGQDALAGFTVAHRAYGRAAGQIVMTGPARKPVGLYSAYLGT